MSSTAKLTCTFAYSHNLQHGPRWESQRGTYRRQFWDCLSSWILKSSATSKCHPLTSPSKSLTWKMTLLFRELQHQLSLNAHQIGVLPVQQTKCAFICSMFTAMMSSNVVVTLPMLSIRLDWKLKKLMIRFSIYQSIISLYSRHTDNRFTDCHANCGRLIKSQWLLLMLSAKLSEVTWCRCCLLLDHWPW